MVKVGHVIGVSLLSRVFGILWCYLSEMGYEKEAQDAGKPLIFAEVLKRFFQGKEASLQEEQP
jgi:hypothetical protein